MFLNQEKIADIAEGRRVVSYNESVLMAKLILALFNHDDSRVIAAVLKELKAQS